MASKTGRLSSFLRQTMDWVPTLHSSLPQPASPSSATMAHGTATAPTGLRNSVRRGPTSVGSRIRILSWNPEQARPAMIAIKAGANCAATTDCRSSATKTGVRAAHTVRASSILAVGGVIRILSLVLPAAHPPRQLPLHLHRLPALHRGPVPVSPRSSVPRPHARVSAPAACRRIGNSPSMA